MNRRSMAYISRLAYSAFTLFSVTALAATLLLQSVYAEDAIGGNEAVAYLDVSVIEKDTSTHEIVKTEKILSGDEYTVVSSDDLTWGDDGVSWYVARSRTLMDGRIEVSGDINLLLTDNCCLRQANSAAGGIHVPPGASLTVYAQSDNDEVGSAILVGASNIAVIGDQL